MTRPTIVDLFAGPGGWDQGLTELGRHDVVGVEWDHDACLTATAAGHARLRADVAAYPPEAFAGVDGLIASPPCQAWSLAGRGKGRDAADDVLAHVATCWDGWVDPPGAICTADVRADLTLQPLRWVDALRPRWVALEQVPPVLGLWEAMADVLRHWGYQADARVINAADYGVPQTRRRAVLLARRDGQPLVWPEVTHFDPRKGMSLFGQPWVSMAEAVGWRPEELLGFPRRDDRGGDGYRDRDLHPADSPAPTVTEKARSWGRWEVPPEPSAAAGGSFMKNHADYADPEVPVLVNGNQANAARRRIDEPAGTMLFAHAINDVRWLMPTGEPLPDWTHDRPATTVVGSFAPDVIAAPGWRGAGDGPRQNAPDSVKVSIAQAGVLQSFPADYPWQGSKSSQFQQCGNAIPPGLARVLLDTLL